MERNLDLDRLRAIAVLGVMWAHFDGVTFGQVPWFDNVRHLFFGAHGVVLFFVISGFIISSTLIPNLDKALKLSQPIGGVVISFFIKRLTRITPLALLWVVIPVICTALINKSGIFGYMEHNLPAAMASALNIFNFYNLYVDHGKSIFGVYWTLSVEEQFYLLFPFFLILFKDIRVRIFALLCIICSFYYLLYRDVGFFHILRMDCIASGVLLYLVSNKKILQLNTYGVWIARILSLVLVLILFCYQPDTPWFLKTVSSVVCSVVLVYMASNHLIATGGGMIDKILDWFGTRSFGIYLSHTVIFRISFAIAYSVGYNSFIVRFILSIILLFIINEIIYRFFETPVRLYGRKCAKIFQIGVSKYA